MKKEKQYICELCDQIRCLVCTPLFCSVLFCRHYPTRDLHLFEELHISSVLGNHINRRLCNCLVFYYVARSLPIYLIATIVAQTTEPLLRFYNSDQSLYFSLYFSYITNHPINLYTQSLIELHTCMHKI